MPQNTPSFIAYDALVDLLQAVFTRAGTSDSVARTLAQNCAGAERDGSLSHGLFRIPGYLGSLKSGWVDGCAVPEVEDVAPGFVRVDACNGFTQPALAAGTPLLLEKLAENGVALIAIRRSHHFGALWPDVEPFARRGLVALSMVNSFACVAPVGGRKPVYGTNPIAFAAPRAGEDPLVFDQAASALANGDVRIAAREGRMLAPGSGIDREGQPTGDPAAILNGGALLPFGGHKGAAIALMIEILSAALTGGNFSFEVDWSKHPGAETPVTGQILILIDPERGTSGGFAARVETLLDRVIDAGQPRLPGDRRYALRRASARDGIPVDGALLRDLQRMAGRSPAEPLFEVPLKAGAEADAATATI
ncbi:lactate dehydrogenase [Rhizobium rhizosphaerae]|uniref:Lactate dehydrogenase n=1 Tax=Xaviernesmea rhizosphaerae TaxID=1672749 RepID=A0ABX3P9G9_9HYPH|nr:Ldh family oxidoreductase [Xaviernesmea rhizosphaerae]OQP85045.1 lactate dehydrogenase [Xaviernesmea rhizosphaerae]